MPNPIFNLLSNQRPSQPNNNLQSFINNFNQFRSSFNGSPKQKVEELLRSGAMTQEQFEQYSAIANQLSGRK